MYGIDSDTINAALSHCKMNLEWPPSIAQFIGICEMINGMPTLEELSVLISSGNINHPIVKMVYAKLDTWAFRNATIDQAHKMLKPLYKKAKMEYRQNNREGNKLLNHE